jgi:hypothetical protein
MNFNFNSAFKPMGFPGMPQMHFPSYSAATPPQPMIPSPVPAPQPVTQVPQGSPGYGTDRSGWHNALDAWRQQRPSAQQFFSSLQPGAMAGGMNSTFNDWQNQMHSWLDQRPERSDYFTQQNPGLMPRFR